MFEDFVSCQVCEHNPTGERCELFGRVIGTHGCSSGVERKPRNHFEEIKAMSMEEMAEFLREVVIKSSWPSSGYAESGVWNKPEILGGKIIPWLDWLKQEATDV